MAGISDINDQNPVPMDAIKNLVTSIDISPTALIVLPAHLWIVAQNIKAVIESADILSGLFLTEVLISVTDDLLNLI